MQEATGREKKQKFPSVEEPKKQIKGKILVNVFTAAL